MSNPAKVGIFSTITIVVFVLGFYFLKGVNLFERKNSYYAVYDRVDGLYKSNFVEINGYGVGRVGDMKRDPRTGKIIVRLDLDKDLKVPDSDSTVASLFSTDFLGTKKIALVLGHSDKYLKEGDTINTYFKKDLTEQLGSQIDPIIATVKTMGTRLDTTVARLNILLDPNNPNGLYGSKAQIDALIGNVNKVVLDNQQTIQLTIKNLQSILANIEKNNGAIDVIVKNAKSVTDSIQQANLKQTIENLNATITQLNQMVKELNEGKGTLGKVLKGDELYSKIDSTIANANKLVKDIKDRPYRYINISVFGAKKHEQRMETKYNESGK